MILGDVGVGKTTFSLNIAQEIFNTKNSKVIFAYTRENTSKLIDRLIFSSEKDNSSFIPIFCSSFDNLLTEILQFETYIANEARYFKTCTYGAIIVDNIFEYYMLEIGTDTKNSLLNNKLNIMLATLNSIAETYHIPVMITNIPKSGQRFEQDSLKKFKNLDIVGFYGGSIVEYWISNIIKIERIGFLGARNVIIFRENENFKREFTAKIENNGFI